MADVGRISLTHPDIDEHEAEAVRRVLESGWDVQGCEVEAFEHAIAAMHRVKHCVCVSSGTAALHVGYLAMAIGPGDVVFVPSFAWPAAANMAIAVGARPAFVDVLQGTYNIDPDDLGEQIDDCRRRRWGRPRAVVVVHQFGLAADMKSVLTVATGSGIEVIEDAACALGACYRREPVGTFGRFGVFSFQACNAITTGEGGAIVTNDDALAARCRSWRNHGRELIDGLRDFNVPGFNYRLTEIQAAIGKVQLRKLHGILARRRELAGLYLEKLKDCLGLRLPDRPSEHTWQTFMVVLDDRLDRTAFLHRVAENGIEAVPGSVAAHEGAVYRRRPDARRDLPESARLHSQGVAVPLHSRMTEWQVAKCASVFIDVARDCHT